MAGLQDTFMGGFLASQASRNDRLRVENETKQLEINKGELNKGLMALDLERDKFKREAINKNFEMLNNIGQSFAEIIANIGKEIPVGGPLDIQLRKWEKNVGESLVLQGLTPEAAAEQASISAGRIRQAANTRNIQKLGAGEQAIDVNRPGEPPIAAVPPKQTDRDATIANLMGQGFSETAAANVADGNTKIVLDPTNGRLLLVDMINNKASELRIGKPEGAKPAAGTGVEVPAEVSPDAPAGIQGTQNVKDAFGAFSVIRSLISKSAGQFFEGFNDEEAENARIAVGTIRERVINAFEKGGKTSLEEQRRILKLLPSEGLFSNPRTAVSNLRTVREQLRSVMERDLVNSENPQLQSKLRQESKSRALEIEIIMSLIDQFVPFAPETTEEVEGYPSGTLFIAPDTGRLIRKR